LIVGSRFVEIAHWSDLWSLAKRLLMTYRPEEIAFSFDYDGTLNARALTPSSKTKTMEHRNVEFGVTNTQARDFLEFLNTERVPWFVNTAAENPSRPGQRSSPGVFDGPTR
jgi:hypothetical protein